MTRRASLPRTLLLGLCALLSASCHSRYLAQPDDVVEARDRFRAHSAHPEFAAWRPDGTPAWISYEDVAPGSAKIVDEDTAEVLVWDESKFKRNLGLGVIGGGAAVAGGGVLMRDADFALATPLAFTLVGVGAITAVRGVFLLVEAGLDKGPERELAEPPPPPRSGVR